MKPRIKLVIVTKDSISTSEIKAPNVTNAMYDAAWDLVYTLSTNKRRTSSLYTQDQKKKAKAKAVPVVKGIVQFRKRSASSLRKPKKLTKRKRKKLEAAGWKVGSAKEFLDTGIHSMVEGNRDDHQT